MKLQISNVLNKLNSNHVSNPSFIKKKSLAIYVKIGPPKWSYYVPFSFLKPHIWFTNQVIMSTKDLGKCNHFTGTCKENIDAQFPS